MADVIGSTCMRPPGLRDFCMTVTSPMAKSTLAGSNGRALPARRPDKMSHRAAARKSGRMRPMMSASMSREMSITRSSASGSMSSSHAGSCTGIFQTRWARRRIRRRICNSRFTLAFDSSLPFRPFVPRRVAT
ncbi:hypothetical protein [Ancylobacter polymorphus]|uniref:Uncharacterized protein n=1 Tax=Ancylobacter polymorphus TaxID=223390 RepID=A0A9E6ZR04_9HYPH|nr:hypothetical protein [Ancylobacter polymorphus]UOK70154.1 hypothetical protein K9D25_15655 [Ancylobacter polymorphus]